ncbi:MAG: histidine kinase, partial [Deltaproteobacteria bacterium]|nr:histidine kinase [Deltaproteobacteria bacterium]
VRFLCKGSPRLLAEVREFMRDSMGFGDFVFRTPAGEEVARARTLKDMTRLVAEVPTEVLLYHARRNHFSTWLMARTEFALARAIRPLRVEEFADADAVRAYLHRCFRSRDERGHAGIVSEFARSHPLDPTSMFVRIGKGSLGGKGRGLAFMNSVLSNHRVEEKVPGVRIRVPPTAILATGVFDAFLESSGLKSVGLEASSDSVVAEAFLSARLPRDAVRDLKAFLQEVRFPLAVRSSSLLEDASSQPFAGVYRTYMIPNNDPSLEVRLQELLTAIRLVYASTYYEDAKAYVGATPNRLEEEKMAVVIQQVAGRRHGDLLYPDVAGIARSRDFYPLDGASPDDGVACAALGLGSLVVDGGRCVRFSPRRPGKVVQFSSVEGILDSAPREFRALDLSHHADPAGRQTASRVLSLGLEVAREHGTLEAVGSLYSPENDTVYDGTGREEGIPLVTLAGILKGGALPLVPALELLLQLGTTAFACPVEIEYAMSFGGDHGAPHDFAFLQVRPMGSGIASLPVSLDHVPREDAICFSQRALGHGLIEGLRDLVYVRWDTFDRGRTQEIAGEIGRLNAALAVAGRRYVLVGPGRWGTSDRWLGIPVSWSQVSHAACFVETELGDLAVEPSQGTHFFQNITSLGLGYFTVGGAGGASGTLDRGWLDSVVPAREGPHVRHLRFDEPLLVA